MNKLNLLSKALASYGLSSESGMINKIAREYMSTVARTGLSSELYENIRALESDIASWHKNTREYLIEHVSRNNPNATYGAIHESIQACLYDWIEAYGINNNLNDTGIPPWFFDFFESKIFPLIKESFLRAIEKLPSDSSTKSELKSWLSQSTLDQLGAPNLYEAIDSGSEFWIVLIRNTIHEIHHNILNHSAWQRFSEFGANENKYNALDAVEEGLTISIQEIGMGRQSDEQTMVLTLSGNISDFLLPTLRRTIDAYDPAAGGFLNSLKKNWDKIYLHIDDINTDEMGIKVPGDKRQFLIDILNDSKDALDSWSPINWTEVGGLIQASVNRVWNKKNEDGEYKWDFLTGDDEKLLINFMEDMEKNSKKFRRLWEDGLEESYPIALAAVSGCIEESLARSANEDAEEEF